MGDVFVVVSHPELGQFARGELPGLLRYAVLLTGDRELAQDLVQDVLVRRTASGGGSARLVGAQHTVGQPGQHGRHPLPGRQAGRRVSVDHARRDATLADLYRLADGLRLGS